MAQILYIHGSGHTHEAFAAQVTAIPGSDAVSLPGHPDGQPLASVAEMAAWLVKYNRWKGGGPAVVVGNSLGAAVALQCALDYPTEVCGLVLIGGGARLRVGQAIFDMIDARWPECIDELVGFSVAASAPDELRERIGSWHLAVGQATTKADFAACNQFDVMERVGSVAVPALIIVGSLDAMTPPKYAQFLNEKIAGSTLHVVEGSGHLPHLEQPDVVSQAIRGFAG